MKWVDLLFAKLINLKRIYGIHVHEINDGGLFISKVLLEKSKKVVHVKEKDIFHSLEDLFGDLDNSIPVALSFDSRKILKKSVVQADDESIKEIMNGTDIDDFYIQTTDKRDGFLVALIRKEKLDNKLGLFYDMKVDLISLILGPSNINILSDFIDFNELGNEIKLPGYKLLFHNNILTEANEHRFDEKGSLKIDSEEIEYEFVIPYSNALTYFLSEGLSEFIDRSCFIGWLQEYKSKIFFRKAFLASLLAIFSILLINFFVLQHFNSIHEDLNGEIVQFQSELKTLDGLTEDFKYKQEITRELGFSNSNLLSFYSDRIAASIKGDIHLISLNIFPLEENRNNRSSMFFEKGRIKVTGACESPTALSDWIMTLKKEDFVIDINNQHYEYDEYKSNANFSFELNVQEP